MNNIEKQVNEDIDDLIGRNILKKINKDNFDENPKNNKKGIIIKAVCVLVPILILGLYFVIGRDFSNNTYSTEERQYAVYQLASKAGYEGTFEEWLESIQGDSIELRVVGNEVQWKPKEAAESEWKKLYDMQDYSGEDGLSALEIWQEIEGNSDKSEEEFFQSLSAYGIWLLQDGNAGKSEEEFFASLKGEDGVDTSNALYVLYKSLGYNKSFEEWKQEYIDSDGNFELDLVKKEYTVTFGNTGFTTKVKDGELISDIPSGVYDNIDVPEFMEQNGWLIDDFKWNLKTTVVKGDLTLEPNFVNKVYTIVYSLGANATHSNPTTITKDDVINLLPAVSQGNTFSRWSSSPNSGGGAETVSLLSKDNLSRYLKGDGIILTANFTTTSYKVTYELNGGINNEDNVTTLRSNAQHTLLDPTKENYEFAGWYNENGVKITQINNPISDVTVTARWTPIEYTISYNLAGGVNNSLNLTTITVEDFIYLYEPQRSGYEFAGWFDENGNKLVFLKDITSNITLTAQWTVDFYIISYDLAGGYNNGNPNIVTYEDDITLTSPQRAGYTFDGWYNGDTKVTSLSGITSNMNLVARWTARDLIVNYVNELNPSNTHPSQTVTCTTENISLEPLTEPGYTFLGWYNGLGNKVNSLSFITENVQLYARWQIVYYNINYDLDGGKQIHYNPEKLTVEESVAINDAYKEYFSFIGWFEGNTQITEIVNPTREYNLVARYEEISYNIYYELNGGTNSAMNKSSITYGTNQSLYNPTKDGYEFGGWYFNAEFYGNTINSISVSDLLNEEIVLYARWNFTISNDNGIEYFYYGTYPQNEATGISGGKVDGEIVFFNGEKYTYYKTKYYKHEAIRWNIIKNESGVMTVYSDSVLDAEAFSSTAVEEFEESSLYSFLNTIFVYSAFHSAGTEIDVKSVYLPVSSQVLTNYTAGSATNYAVAKSEDTLAGGNQSTQWWINDIPSKGTAKFCVNSSVGTSSVSQTSKLGVRPHLIVTM